MSGRSIGTADRGGPARAVPLLKRLAPWTCKKGRFDRMRATVFLLLLVPGIQLALRWNLADLGARPLKAAIHSTGYWALWLLLASLAVTPIKAVAYRPGVVVVRRMVGVAALGYALIHVTLWLTDENWRLLDAASEILQRFYLTIGAAVLSVLIVLGVTSTDGMARRLGPAWKRLHKTVYAAAALAMVHYYMQSKADVSQAVIASGVLGWLLLWRLLPAGRDRSALPMLQLAAGAGLLALGFEFVWYRFGTHVDAVRVLFLEADPTYGLHPAALVLAFGLLLTVAIALRAVAGTPFGARAVFVILIYASGALWAPLASAVFGLGVDDAPEPGALPLIVFASGTFALLGLVRYRVRALGWRTALDVLFVACSLYPLVLNTDWLSPQLVIGVACTLAAAALAVSGQLWSTARTTALSGTTALAMLPLLGWLAAEATLALVIRS